MGPQTQPAGGQVSALLKRWRSGDREAEVRLTEMLLPDLRRLAQDEAPQPAVVVREAYSRLTGWQKVDGPDRQLFQAMAARAMRRYLVDKLRRESNEETAEKSQEAADIDRLLNELERENAEQCLVVEFRYFLGLNDEETSEAMGIPLRSAQMRWLEARQWLFRKLDLERHGLID